MKTVTNYTQILFLNLLLVLSINVNAQDFTNAKSYSDYILVEQAKVINDNIHYISKSMHDHTARQNDEDRKTIIAHIKESISRIEAMPSFKGDATLKLAAIDVFKMYLHTYEFECKKADSIGIEADNMYSSMKAYFEAQDQAEEKLLEAGKKFLKIQKAFVKKYHLAKEDKENENLCLFTKIAQVNDYSRDIFLAYSKVAQINKEFFFSLKKKQVESMEKNRVALMTVANETITFLTQISHFENNKEYLDKAIKLTTYMKNIASQEYAELVAIAKDKNSTFDDANKFNKIVMSHHKQAKNLLNEFTVAGTSLMQKTVFHESNQITAQQMQTDINKALAQTQVKIIQEKPVLAATETRVMPQVPQD